MKSRADRFLDIRKCISPIILLKACQAFREMKDGETIEILLSDPDIGEDLFKILPPSRYRLVSSLEEESFYRIVLKKKV